MKIELSGHYGYRRILKTMLPSVFMMLATSIYSIVDGYFVANFAGGTAFAAMNIIWPALAVMSAIGLMIGTGGSALISKTFGGGEPQKACQYFTMLVRFAIVVGVLSTVLLMIFMRPLVTALGAKGEMIPMAVSYGRIVGTSMPFFILQMAFQSFYMTAERPQMGTWMSIICGIANVGLDALLVVGFGMGLSGAAIATSLTLCLGGIFPLLWFSSRRNATHLHFVRTGYDWKAIGHSCTNGLSEYVGNIALNVVGICYNLQLMKYIGENGVSAYGILMYLGFIFASLYIGYNISISQVVAFNYGAGNTQEIKSLLKKSAVLMGSFGIVITLVSEMAAMPIARVFVGFNEELCQLSAHATRIYMLSFLICGFNMFTSAWFTAFGNGIISAIAAFTRTLVFELSAIWILPQMLGIDGIWMAVNVAEVLALALSICLIFGFRKRYGY